MPELTQQQIERDEELNKRLKEATEKRLKEAYELDGRKLEIDGIQGKLFDIQTHWLPASRVQKLAAFQVMVTFIPTDKRRKRVDFHADKFESLKQMCDKYQQLTESASTN